MSLQPAFWNRFLEPLFDELHKIIHDPACAGITLSTGAEGRGPSFSDQGPSTDTQSTRDKPDSAVSFSTLFRSVLPGINTGNQSVAESVLAQFLNGPESESESAFESECPMFAQVASLTEQVNTLQDDVKMLVDLNRELYDGLRVLGELVIGRAVAKSN